MDVITVDLMEQSQPENSLILEAKLTNTENPIFLNEFAAQKEKEALKFTELQKKVESLESDIIATTKEIEKKTTEHEEAEKKFNEDKKNALLTTDMLSIAYVFGSSEKK